MKEKIKSVKSLRTNGKVSPKINLQGSILEDCGFKPGDIIKMRFYHQRITICLERNEPEIKKIPELYNKADVRAIWQNLNPQYNDTNKYNLSLCKYFTKNLSPNQRGMFDKIINNIYDNKSREYEAIFVEGYKTGANITLETLFF